MKAFRFLFDEYTGLYTGVVRSPFPENSTEQDPHFNFDCKTVYDRNFHCWKLVPKYEFYQQFAQNDLLASYDLETKRSILKLCEFLDEKFKQNFYNADKFDINNADRFIYLKEVLIEQMKNLSANNDLIQANKGCLFAVQDTIRRDVSTLHGEINSELKFLKSQIMYLTNVVEKPNFIIRFFRWIAGR